MVSANPNHKKHTKIKYNQPKPRLKKSENLSNQPLPSHKELMLGFQKHLKVTWNDVCIGIAVEQAFVNKAGITKSQSGASYRSNSSGQTSFLLNLDNKERGQLTDYYNNHFTGLITKTNGEVGSGSSVIVTNTKVLHYGLSPALAIGIG